MKKWYKSRTLWLNVLASVGLFAQNQFGFVIPMELQAVLIAWMNILLRFDTTEALH